MEALWYVHNRAALSESSVLCRPLYATNSIRSLSFLRIREQYAAFDLSAVRLRDSQGNNGEGGERTLHVERFGTRPKSHDA